MDYTEEEQELAFEQIVQIRIKTLIQIMRIINSASTKGVFNATELSLVGNMYDSFLKKVNDSLESARVQLNGSGVVKKQQGQKLHEKSNQKLQSQSQSQLQKQHSQQYSQQSQKQYLQHQSQQQSQSLQKSNLQQYKDPRMTKQIRFQQYSPNIDDDNNNEYEEEQNYNEEIPENLSPSKIIKNNIRGNMRRQVTEEYIDNDSFENENENNTINNGDTKNMNVVNENIPMEFSLED